MGIVRRRYRDPETGEVTKSVWGYDFVEMKRRYRKAGFRTRKEAENAERKKLREVQEGRLPQKLRPATLKKIEAEFLDYRRIEVADSTWRNETNRMRAIAPLFGKRHLHTIIEADIRCHMAYRKRHGVSNRTINLELQLIRTLYKFALIHGYAQVNPAKEIKHLDEDADRTGELRIPTDEEFLALVDAASKTRFSTELIAWLYLRAYTGIRPGESFELRWQDIDFKKEQIKVRWYRRKKSTKGMRRYIDLHPELKVQLLEWRDEWEQKVHGNGNDHDWVFFHPQTRTKRAKGFKGAFEHARKRAGLPWLTSYSLRHYFVSKCVMKGIDYLTIMRWTGHKSSKMIDEVYGHLHPEHRREQIRKLTIGKKR